MPGIWDDMPGLVDANASSGGFIPPPPGATQGGQPGIHDQFPGAQSAPAWPGTPWPSASNQLPDWANPSSANDFSYGQRPFLTATSPWAAPSPVASWGMPTTPGGSWGPTTPTSATGFQFPTSAPADWPSRPSPYPQSPYFPAPQESTFGQPVAASPWFGGGQQPMAMGGSLVRSKSYSGSRPKSAMKRSRSQGHGGARWGTSGGYGHAEVYDERNLARRPRDWRADYNPRSGLASYIPKVGRGRSDVKESNDPVRRVLHPLLLYKTPNPPIIHDLRENPLARDTVEFPLLQRRHNDLDFAQLATHPPTHTLRLYHPRLPWYIDINQSHPNGVTVFDILTQMYEQLMQQITGRHYWNEDLEDVDRAKLGTAFQERCNGDPGLIAAGVRRVDFLERRLLFQGLVRGRNGMWEIKTSKID